MKKNLIFRLLQLMMLSALFHSCMHDETFASSDPASKEYLNSGYTNKSLWKEDEKYIKNVRKVFDTYADKNYFSNHSGEIYWDYALTMGTFDESFLEVPVIKNGKINYILVVNREKDRIYFKRKEDQDAQDFFNVLVFKDRKQLTGRIVEELSASNSGTQDKGSVCYMVEVRWSWTNADGSPGETFVYHHMRCTFIGPALPTDDIYPSGGGGGGGGGGYPYPDIPQNQDICEKLKTQNSNQAFKDKVSGLDKKEIFDKKQETGFAAAYGTTPFEQMPNTSDGNVRLPDGNKYFGYMHAHLNMDGVVKIFSPYDITTFLTSCVANAKLKGNMLDAYAMVITSEGNYILKYSGDGNFAITSGQFESWQTWYEKEYSRLYSTDKLTQSNVEKVFAQFLKEQVKIDGLEIYKSDKTTGNTSRLEYDGKDNPLILTPCP